MSVYAYSSRDKTVRLLAQASNDENWRAGSESDVGDQIASELDAVAWYQHVSYWGKVYRLNDPKLRELVARFMEDSVCNGWVGYNTNLRGTHELALKQVGYDPNKVSAGCVTDCAMLAYEAVKRATGVDVNSYADPVRYTGPYPGVWSFDYYMERILPLNDIGVTVFTVPNYLNGSLRKSDTVINYTDAQHGLAYVYESAFDDKTAYLYDYNYGVEIGADVPELTEDATQSAAYQARQANNRREYGTAGAAKIAANLTVNIGEQYLSYLTGASNLIRGDILRTRSPRPQKLVNSSWVYGGAHHIAVWI